MQTPGMAAFPVVVQLWSPSYEEQRYIQYVAPSTVLVNVFTLLPWWMMIQCPIEDELSLSFWR